MRSIFALALVALTTACSSADTTEDTDTSVEGALTAAPVVDIVQGSWSPNGSLAIGGCDVVRLRVTGTTFRAEPRPGNGVYGCSSVFTGSVWGFERPGAIAFCRSGGSCSYFESTERLGGLVSVRSSSRVLLVPDEPLSTATRSGAATFVPQARVERTLVASGSCRLSEVPRSGYIPYAITIPSLVVFRVARDGAVTLAFAISSQNDSLGNHDVVDAVLRDETFTTMPSVYSTSAYGVATTADGRWTVRLQSTLAAFGFTASRTVMMRANGWQEARMTCTANLFW